MQWFTSRRNIPGIILIGLGLLFLMINYNIDIRTWLVLVIGIIFLIYYFIKKRTEFLILGLLISYLGSVIFLKTTKLVTGNVFAPTLLILLGVIFLIVYFLKKKGWSLYPGVIFPAIGIYQYILTLDTVNKAETWPLIFMNLSIAFLIIFIFEFKNQGYKPLIISLIFFSMGVFAFLTSKGFIDKRIWAGVTGLFKKLWPLILIIVGIIFMLKSSIKRKQY